MRGVLAEIGRRLTKTVEPQPLRDAGTTSAALPGPQLRQASSAAFASATGGRSPASTLNPPPSVRRDTCQART